MTALDRPDLHAAIEQRFPDNTNERITPELLRDGLHEIVDAAFITASDEGAVPNVPFYDAGTDYIKGYTVRYPTGTGVDAFYYSLRAGKLPAPSGSSADVNWKMVPGPVASAALSQQLTLLQAQAIEGSQVVPGRSYLIDFGPDAAGNAQVVTLLGTAANLFAIQGQLTVAGVRSSVRVDVASGTFGQEASLLDTANDWKKQQTFTAGAYFGTGNYIDANGSAYLGFIDLANQFTMGDGGVKMTRSGMFTWNAGEYNSWNVAPDVGLERKSAGVLLVNSGVKGSPAQLEAAEFRSLSAPASLDTISKLAAKKANLDPATGRQAAGEALEAEYPLYIEDNKYKYDDQALGLQIQAVGKRVNPLTGKLETDADYTTFLKVKVQPGVTYESVGIGIAYAAYIDVTNAWRQAWTLDSNGASAAIASYNSRAFSPPTTGSVVEIYLWLSVRNDDVPYVRIRPTQLYNDQELRRLIAAVSNQTLFNYVPLAASSVDNYVTASYFGSLYELSFGSGIDPSATNLNVWLPLVTTTNVKQSVVVRLLASQTGKTVSIYGRPAATALGDRVLLQVLKPGDSAGFTVMSAYSSPYVGYGIIFSTVLPTAGSGGGTGGVTPQQLEAVRSTVVVGATISGDVTLQLAAAGALLPVSTNCTITVPATADVPFPVGTVLELVPTTAAMPLIAAASGVTILAATGNRGAGQGSPLRLVQLAPDSWLLTGGA